jgi:hypothetical protein
MLKEFLSKKGENGAPIDPASVILIMQALKDSDAKSK